jgi:hypothetical protein
MKDRKVRQILSKSGYQGREKGKRRELRRVNMANVLCISA